MNNSQLIAHILKQGGKLLIVGGETKDLPRPYHEHSQILIWDDNQQNFAQKEIPHNVRIIMWNRWVSHATQKKLNEAAKSLHAVKFPLLKPREMKDLLSEVVYIDKPQEDIPAEVIEQEIEEVNKTVEPLDLNEAVKDTIPMAKHIHVEQGTLQKFYAKHLNINRDYSIKGAKVNEAKRLFEIANREGVKTTLASLANGLGVFLKRLEKGRSTPTPRKPVVTTTKESTVIVEDDFAQLETLIVDAIAAMKLVQEHLPKVRRETEKLRGLKQKFLKLLE